MTARNPENLRTGWTTGACATAAAKAAVQALLTGQAPDDVEITLPRGQTPSFAIETCQTGPAWAEASVRKDAGDDPDVTDKALIRVRIEPGTPGQGIAFRAGAGVGRVTQPGLPIPPGEPAINPVPREMIAGVLREAALAHASPPDFTVTISVPGGEALAEKTWNGRLGIVGGISILGTTGIVRPFSCAAWIASIHRGIDVARAARLPHVMGATGATSEATVRALLDLPEIACLDMGDFAGGMLKYLRRHPVPRLTVAGGFGKLTKLAQGALDLHSGRSQVDFSKLADTAEAIGRNPGTVRTANTALEALQHAGPALAQRIAEDAHATIRKTLDGAEINTEVMIVARDGALLARTGPAA
ncbi:MAG: cobalt-precorrin-5B (C(1))-methyltransferase [Pseudomonadota bacterium]